MVGDPRRNATSQLRLRARLSMKSLNLNLKHACDPCKTAAVRKRRRLDKEEEKRNFDAGEDEENNDIQELEEDETDEEEDVTEISGVKRKRSGEQHSHCHCPLFNVTEPLLEFMSSGQPYRRFKADQLKKREAAKVDRVLSLQKKKLDKLKYDADIKKEITRFKQALKLLKNANLSKPRQVSCF